jgi:hypothetical protein
MKPDIAKPDIWGTVGGTPLLRRTTLGSTSDYSALPRRSHCSDLTSGQLPHVRMELPKVYLDANLFV